MRWVHGAVLLAYWTMACGGTSIRYYQAQVAEEQLRRSKPNAVPVVLAVASFQSDVAYDEQRIVYRTSDQRLDYYHFHRWSSSPGDMAAVVLRETYRKLGRFRYVVGGLDPRADVILSGRVVALEEVDLSEDRWEAHVSLELTLRDTVTGDVLWNQLVEERQPIEQQTPEGVALSVGKALTRIGLSTAGAIASAAPPKPRVPQLRASVAGAAL